MMRSGITVEIGLARRGLRTVLLGTVAALLVMAGCSQMFPRDSKKEAKERWGEVRARLKYQLALESFKTRQLDEAQKHLGESLAMNPSLGAGHVLKARILLERGETAAASAALDVALRSGTDNAETDYLSGLIAQRYDRFDDALAWYQRAAEREPMQAHYVAAVAETLVALGRPTEALRTVEARFTDFEQNATLRAMAGEIYLMLDRYGEAAAAYRDAVRIAPEDKRVRGQLGLALTFAGNYQEAEIILSELVQESAKAAPTEDTPSMDTSLLIALGRCRLARGAPEAAEDVLRQATRVDPESRAGWALLARAALSCRDLLTARTAAERAAELDSVGENYLLLGYICWTQRDYAAAVRAAERVLRERREDSMALYLLAQSQHAAGQMTAAESSCRRALQDNPQCQWAQRLLDAPAPPQTRALAVPAMPFANKPPPPERSRSRP